MLMAIWHVSSGAETAEPLLRDQRLLGPRLDLLHCPGIAIGIGEAEERTAILLAEDRDLTGRNAAGDQLLARRVRVGDDKLETRHRARLHRVHPGSIAEHD